MMDKKYSFGVVISVYNEEKNIINLLDSLLNQTLPPHEVVFVDDGSTDKTGRIIKNYQRNHIFIKYIYQKNSGPAKARNKAWENCDCDVCVFTDGDCVPEKNWLEEIVNPFNEREVGAVAGSYKTINKKSLVARFVGYEFDRRYDNIKKEVDSHGTYNLAVRRKVLKEVEGFCENYPKPSCEDLDLTYKISKKYKIVFNRQAIVGHYHPEKFWKYMKIQFRRGYDRVQLYRSHPGKAFGDSYTEKIIKYQVALSGLFPFSLFLIYPFFKGSFIIPLGILIFLVYTSAKYFFYYYKKDKKVAFCSILIQFFRNFSWFFGWIAGFIKHKHYKR